MKSESGVTLTSLIVYVIAMVVVIGIVATLTKYFYGNLDTLTNRNESAKEYTLFNSYFTNDINTRNNKIITEASDDEITTDESTGDRLIASNRIVFSNGNQYSFLKQNPEDEDSVGSIYMNKILICDKVDKCQFYYYTDANKVAVHIEIDGKNYYNTYSLTNNY